ncbi:MAG: prepilin-type N-terminal cleavage/methylation domain-containing protein [Cyanobacteria bacterium K_Offshore_0m_m2_072]|nr:prepilin-type N-terminal cleavage/methylation domain-containing protein [Cyanobacteria bacterium K_Offshore_0m_m2_072]
MGGYWGRMSRAQCALSPSASQAGMTFLEVLIAIALFAVFSASFLMVTEMLAALLPAANSPAQADGCDGPGLELACINVAFDQLVPELEKDLEVSTVCPSSINSMPGSAGLSWPEAYDVCVYKYPGPGLDEQAGSAGSPPRPGLYLLQAQAKPGDSAFWRVPVQRVFCRPYHLCVK